MKDKSLIGGISILIFLILFLFAGLKVCSEDPISCKEALRDRGISY